MANVYGICENKCKKKVYTEGEVLTKDQAFGIAKSATWENTTSDTSFVLEIGLYESSCNSRVIAKNYGKVRFDTAIENFPDNFNVDLTFYRNQNFTTDNLPDIVDVININTHMLLLNYIYPPGFKASECNVLHCNIFFDGLNLCCRVEGYVA